MGRQITDQEAYPAILAACSVLLLLFLAWKYVLGEPTVSRCWFWETLHIYCPGCGGTRALIALAHGHLLEALSFHAPFVITALTTGIYLISQTVWRLRGKRGWVLHYAPFFPVVLAVFFLIHCIIRNVLLLEFGIAI